MATDDIVSTADLRSGLTATGPAFIQTNLISDGFVSAQVTDANLRNAWGVSFGPTTPFWISDQAANVTTIDRVTNDTVTKDVIAPVAVPSPTGQVFNNAPTAFLLPNGGPASFLFASTTGSLYGWSADAGAVQVATTPNAAYTGLAIGTSDSGPTLYAANVRGGTVDMFNGQFQAIGSFKLDPNIPAGYGPYNVQVLDGSVYVTYSKQDRSTGEGFGFVDKYDLNGTPLARVASGGALNDPWGLAIAPKSFGSIAGDLLVGNFGDGTINVFDLTNGAALGQLLDKSGQPIAIDGLWALTPGNGTSAGDANTIYFSAGPVKETHGVFGSITIAPTA